MSRFRKREVGNEMQDNLAPASGGNKLLEEASKLLVEGRGGAVLCTGIHLGVSVSADVRPTIELAARQERVLPTPMPCCYVIVIVI